MLLQDGAWTHAHCRAQRPV